MSWRIWRNRLPLRGVLRPSIPDNNDYQRRFHGMGRFPASRERETGCRFARFYVQAFRTTAIGRDAFTGWANFLRRANVKRAAASRGFTFKHSGQRRLSAVLSRMDGFPASPGRETGRRFAEGTFSHSGQRRFRGMDGFSFPRGRYVQAFRTTIRLLRSVCTVRRTFRRRCGAGFSYL